MGGYKLDLTNSQDVLLKYIQKPDGSGLPSQCRRKSRLPSAESPSEQSEWWSRQIRQGVLHHVLTVGPASHLNCFWKINYWLQCVHISFEGGSVDSLWPVRFSTGRHNWKTCSMVMERSQVTCRSDNGVHSNSIPHYCLFSMLMVCNCSHWSDFSTADWWPTLIPLEGEMAVSFSAMSVMSCWFPSQLYLLSLKLLFISFYLCLHMHVAFHLKDRRYLLCNNRYEWLYWQKICVYWCQRQILVLYLVYSKICNIWSEMIL